MKKVNIYTSKAGQGKTFVMMIDAVKLAAQGKRVAFITAELNGRFVIKRMNHIAKYFDLKGKISKNNLVIFESPFGEETLNRVEKIKKDFDVLFLDPFEAIQSFDHTPEKPIYKRVQDSYMNLIDVLNSDESVLQNINTTVNCYRAMGSNGFNVVKTAGLSKELEDKVALKTFCSKGYFGDKAIIVACDFEDRSVKEYNLIEIMK